MESNHFIKEEKDECCTDRLQLTFKTIAALMHPWTRGIVLLHSSRAEQRDFLEATSHSGVMILRPCSRSSLTIFTAASDLAPDLDGTMRFLAPFEAIHLRIDRPIPPSPPTTRYEERSSNLQVGRMRRCFCWKLAHVHLAWKHQSRCIAFMYAPALCWTVLCV